MSLSSLNLNHLLALDALLAERNVTRAAQRIGVSQSALSHTLRGLRDQLGDPLLVRGAGGMVPTERAAAMAAPLRRALQELELAVSASPVFDPGTSTRRFVLAMGDAHTLTVLPGLLARVRAEAPGVELDVRPPPGGSAAPGLESGEFDAALEVRPADLPGIRTRLLYEEDFACVVRADHPSVGETLDLDTWTALPHALMSPTGRGQGAVDLALAELGRSRRVRLKIRYFLAAPLVVAASDLVLTAPRRLADAMAELAPLRVLEPPIPLPRFPVRLTWHARSQDDPAHRWLREAVRAAARA